MSAGSCAGRWFVGGAIQNLAICFSAESFSRNTAPHADAVTPCVMTDVALANPVEGPLAIWSWAWKVHSRWHSVKHFSLVIRELIDKEFHHILGQMFASSNYTHLACFLWICRIIKSLSCSVVTKAIFFVQSTVKDHRIARARSSPVRGFDGRFVTQSHCAGDVV